MLSSCPRPPYLHNKPGIGVCPFHSNLSALYNNCRWVSDSHSPPDRPTPGYFDSGHRVSRRSTLDKCPIINRRPSWLIGTVGSRDLVGERNVFLPLLQRGLIPTCRILSWPTHGGKCSIQYTCNCSMLSPHTMINLTSVKCRRTVRIITLWAFCDLCIV